MKCLSEVITQLNEVLNRDVTAVNQYFLHTSMCKNWGYVRLSKKIYGESDDEMRHAHRLIDSIFFLGNIPALAFPLSGGSFHLWDDRSPKAALIVIQVDRVEARYQPARRQGAAKHAGPEGLGVGH